MVDLRHDLTKFDVDKSNQTQNDQANMSLLAMIMNAKTGVVIEHQFLMPGQSGIGGDKRWGYRIKGIDPKNSTAKKQVNVKPAKMAEALKIALRASGFGDDMTVICTPTGIWLDGETVTKFGDAVRKGSYTDLTEAEKLKIDAELSADQSTLKSQGTLRNPEIANFILIDTSTEPYKLFVASLDSVNLLDQRRR